MKNQDRGDIIRALSAEGVEHRECVKTADYTENVENIGCEKRKMAAGCMERVENAKYEKGAKSDGYTKRMEHMRNERRARCSERGKYTGAAAKSLRIPRRLFAAWLAVIFAVTSVFVLTNQPVSAASEVYMKIGLSYGYDASPSVDLTSDSGFFVASVGTNSIDTSKRAVEMSNNDNESLTKADKITLNLSDGSVQLICGGEAIASLKADGSECIVGGNFRDGGSDASGQAELIGFGGKNYRGGIIPYLNSNGQLNIINYLSIDDYVRGVVHSEIGQSSHIEAIKAQAVAIRSFAYVNRDTHKDQGFDMCTTTHCQVYSGADSEYRSTNRAVDETLGEMIYYENKPAAAYYCANSGGHTQNSEDVWTKTLGHLRGKPDEYSPESNWTVSMTRADLTAKMAPQGIGTVESVTVDRLDPSGYVASLTINGSRDSKTYTKETIRSALGVSLRSRFFTITSGDGSGSTGGQTSETGGASSAGGEYYGQGSSGVSPLGSSVNILSSGGITVKQFDGLTVMNADGQKKVVQAQQQTPSDGQNSAASVMTVTFSADSDLLIINGKGFGHGVGMSQQGAQQMGLKGFSYKDILNYYYTGIEVK